MERELVLDSQSSSLSSRFRFFCSLIDIVVLVAVVCCCLRHHSMRLLPLRLPLYPNFIVINIIDFYLVNDRSYISFPFSGSIKNDLIKITMIRDKKKKNVFNKTNE